MKPSLDEIWEAASAGMRMDDKDEQLLKLIFVLGFECAFKTWLHLIRTSGKTDSEIGELVDEWMKQADTLLANHIMNGKRN